MDLSVRDIMVKDFITVHPDTPVRDAVRLIFDSKVRETGYKAFGIMVKDELGKLVGMFSMFDVLYHLRPPFMNYEVDSLTVWNGELEPHLEQFHDLKVEQIMSSPVVTVSPEDHLMVAIDRMIKKRSRRLPVVENGNIVGILYLSDVFHHLCSTWLDTD